VKKRLATLIAAASLLGLAAGCSHLPFIGKKRPAVGKTEKMNPKLSTQVQIDFHTRWIEKQVSALVAQGKSPEAARAEAEREYEQQYPFATPGGK
jgi:hypothetical protein